MAYILAGRALRSLGCQYDSICQQCSGSTIALFGLRATARTGERLVPSTKRHLATYEPRPRPLPRWWSPLTSLFSPYRVRYPLIGPRFSSSSSSLPNSSSASLSDNVRHLMRSVPHPVAIITSTSTYTTPTSSSNSSVGAYTSLDLFRGATVSSFNTVALTPTPIVSFNITRHSSTFRAIQLSGLFNVHLLTGDVQHEEHHGINEDSHCSHPEFIASKFSMGNKGRPFHQETGEVERWIDLSASTGQSAPISSTATAAAGGGTGRAAAPGNREVVRLPPVIRGQTDEGVVLVPFHLMCEHMTEKTVWIGDHVVVFGRVVSVVDNLKNNDELHHGDRKATLAYVLGNYARVV